MTTLQHRPLGRQGPLVNAIGLGTMTFGEQVPQDQAHAILDRALERGLDFIDTAEVYSVPTKRETYGATESIIGNWFAARPGARQRVFLASKVAGPSRNMDWVRNGSSNLRAADIVAACNDSLRRLRTEVIDLYQIHWPNRNVPVFGATSFDPGKDAEFSSVDEQLRALDELVRAGKIRHIGLSNETPYGVCEFVRVAEAAGLPRIVSVQNPYSLSSRALDNGLDETLHRLGVGMLAYSPLAFGVLSGKYDEPGFDITRPALGRMALFETMRQQRWGRPEHLAASQRYSALARAHGLTPTRMALAFCYGSWRVSSTLIGVTSTAQLDEALDAWGTVLSPELLSAIDAVRKDIRDPAQ